MATDEIHAQPIDPSRRALGTGSVRVHVVQTGRLVGNRTFLRGEGWSSLLRRREDVEFPVYSYILEQPDGLVAIDAGMTARVRVRRLQRRFVPSPVIEPHEEIGPQLRARGLRPEDVRRVVVTHLDWDHMGGIAHFPNAEVLVHRPEYAFASSFGGRQRYQPRLWPGDLAPTLYDLRPEPYGPFPASAPLPGSGDARLVPIPGHSIGQVGLIVPTDGGALFFTGDHLLRQDWFLEDYPAGRLVQLGVFFRRQAIETSRRIRRLTHELPTVLLPAHDADAPARLAAMAPCPR